jgi:hypothetical protein
MSKEVEEIHGTLENWYQIGPVMCGHVYGDTKLRFRDGSFIRTSCVLSRSKGIIKTINSNYKLGKEAKT